MPGISLVYKKNSNDKTDSKKILDSLNHLSYYHSRVLIDKDNCFVGFNGYDSYPTTRTVDNFVLAIRKQIEADPSDPKHLITIYRAGYKFKLYSAAASLGQISPKTDFQKMAVL